VKLADIHVGDALLWIPSSGESRAVVVESVGRYVETVRGREPSVAMGAKMARVSYVELGARHPVVVVAHPRELAPLPAAVVSLARSRPDALLRESVRRALAPQFAAELRRRRTALGLSRAALAAAVRVTERAVELWERGSSTPTEENLRVLCAAIGVEPVAFMDEVAG